MNRQAPPCFSDPERVADAVIDKVGSDIVLALPLGLGKANHLANALFDRAAADRSLSLKILTALSLEAPVPGSELERRFIEPIADRYFGRYPALAYVQSLRRNNLPENVQVQEFFLQPGNWLNNQRVQQNYLSVNYTHALATLLRSGFNVLGQLVAPSDDGSADNFSLSCNPDISVDLFKARERGEIEFLAVAQVNRNLPFMRGEAVRPVANFDLVLDGDAVQFPLFHLPHQPVSLADHAIGLQVARLIPDGGTLQVGIGSIGDAIFNALLLRQRDNRLFHRLLEALGVDRSDPDCFHEPFTSGLYASSEMLVEGFLHLLEAGILKREVDGIALHAGFFIGSPLFYRLLAELPEALRNKIAMMPVSFTNELYRQEDAKRQARTDARFVNSALMATLLGAVVSDGLEDGRVVSGVGGQYNFVAMAFALEGARSIITLPATRTSQGKVRSNIRWSYGHVTIPRHLRDIVVTEYGVADLRDKTDAEVIAAMLGVADSRFQDELLDQARSAGKVPKNFQLPVSFRQNTPEHLTGTLKPFTAQGRLAPFPLGSDFSPTEERLAAALQTLATLAGSNKALAKLAWRGVRHSRKHDDTAAACLARMSLERPESIREWVYRLLLQGVLT
jgi:acyl-CoA hydrolase